MWNDAVLDAATSYPDVSFILVDAELSVPSNNVISILFDVDEAAFPLGFLSAWWADSQDNDPAVGSVGAMLIPQIRQFIEPFNYGAQYYNTLYGRDVDTLRIYAGEFFNKELGKELADSLIILGADIIFGVGSETGMGALLKAKEKQKQGIGVDVDQYYSFPEVSDILLSSAMKGLDNAIYDVVQLYVTGYFVGGGVYNGKLDNDGVKMAPFHDYDQKIADSIKMEILNIRTGIINGSITTGW